MDIGLDPSTALADRRQSLLQAVADAGSLIAADAAARDADAAFPCGALDLLRAAGALAAVVPVACGGLGLGTDPAAAETAELLRLVGQASLPLGRVFEGHMNAVRLVCRSGTTAQAAAAGRDARAGHLFGVWNTDGGDPLTIAGDRLCGAKILASGAGTVTRALVTAAGEERPLLLVRLAAGERCDLARWTAQGMRASATGRVDFSGIGLDGGDVERIGRPGAYLDQPDFSGGAWRVLAVQLGGLDAVVGELRHGLVSRGRDGDPHQLARFGAAMVARETAWLFVQRAALLVEAEHRVADEVVAYVGLARTAVEAACIEAMRLAQRSLGLSAFMRPAPIERICRDLSTYLRQPVPDAVLDEAAAYFLQHPRPAELAA